MRFAITPKGAGNAVGYREIQEGWALVDGEAFAVDFNPVGYVLADNGSSLRPATGADNLKAEKKRAENSITVARNAALLSLTADWDGDKWDADEATSARIANALSMIREAAALGIPVPDSIPWRTADNKDRTLTIAELTQMGAAVFLAQQTVWAKQAQLKNSIAAAPNENAVKGVAW
jgi:hypothetical protein